MLRDEILAKLRAREAELRARGVQRMALFGSVARGDNESNSDVDLIADLDRMIVPNGFGYFGFLDNLRQDLERFLGRSVDIVTEPVINPRLRFMIERDRVQAF